MGAISNEEVILAHDEFIVSFPRSTPTWDYLPKHKEFIEKAIEGGLPSYVKLITKVSEYTHKMSYHNGSSPLGCFGKNSPQPDFCTSKCPIAALCKNSNALSK